MPHDDVTPNTTSPGYQKAPNNIRGNQTEGADDIRESRREYENEDLESDSDPGPILPIPNTFSESENTQNSNILPELDLGDGNSKTQPVGSPQRDGETSIGGHMPDLESDDDVSKIAA